MFLLMLTLLTASVAAVIIDATFYERSTSIADVAEVSRLPGLALSVSFYEPRVRAYRDTSDLFYPSMQPINSMDFVYAQ